VDASGRPLHALGHGGHHAGEISGLKAGFEGVVCPALVSAKFPYIEGSCPLLASSRMYMAPAPPWRGPEAPYAPGNYPPRASR
jgi:hypothetical protein